jgi:flavin reductase (DIM6/NTAB) family NADH-FMN oxidoreductase RutF
MIHDENPFAEPPDRRDPARRFRGRLSSAVTIVTAGGGRDRTGLTISSLLVVEGEPAMVELVVGPTSDLWDAVAESGHFVIHICHEEDRELAQVFAGLRPSPGGVFAGIEVRETAHGPVIERLANRAFCSFDKREELGFSGLVTGRIDEVSAAEIDDPLVYFRGNYRSLQ